MAYREDQILQMPLPDVPSIAQRIRQGVLRKPDAMIYDQDMKQWKEGVTNVLRLVLRWPQLERWENELRNISTLQTGLSSALATISALQTSINTLSSSSGTHTAQIATLQAQVANIIAWINTVTRIVFIFSTPASSWALPHNKGAYPNSVRILVQLPALAGLLEFGAKVTDTDTNNSVADFSANYQGRAILDF